MNLCQICDLPVWADWKVYDLIEDKTYYACEEHLVEILPKSDVIKLTRQRCPQPHNEVAVLVK